MIADLEACDIITMPLAHDAALSSAERFAFFKAHVTEQDLAEYREHVREQREFDANWMALAEFSR